MHKKNHPTEELDSMDLTDFITYITSVDNALIKIGPDQRFGEVVVITPKGVDWAEEWALHYENLRGHHSERIPI